MKIKYASKQIGRNPEREEMKQQQTKKTNKNPQTNKKNQPKTTEKMYEYLWIN